MTLEELQAEFPHGSRWRGPSSDGESVFTVVGWDLSDAYPVIVLRDGGERLDRLTVGGPWERIPDPVPCPITEPTTVRCMVVGRIGNTNTEDRTRWGTGGTGTAVTLHPAEPGATEGRYTWDQP